MTDRDLFERRLQERLQAHVAPEGLVFDAGAIASGAIERADRTQWSIRLRDRLVLPARVGRSPAGVVAVVLLATVLAAAAFMVAGQSRPSPLLPIPAERGGFTPTGSMARDRHGEYTVTLLPDDRVLVIGGYFTPWSAELWDPATGLWTDAGRLVHPRASHSARLLPDGRVLVVGGYDPETQGEETVPPAPPEAWDPTTMTFQDADPSLALDPPGVAELGSETRAPDRYLVIDADGRAWVYPLRRAWRPGVDPSTVAGWEVVNPRSAAAVVLADGRVLTLGGSDADGGLMHGVKLAAIWDPTTGISTPTGSMATADRTTMVYTDADHGTLTYGYPNAVALSDGRVLVVHPQSAELFELR